MTKNLQIEGMTCGHCVAAIRRALEAVPGVERAEVSLEEGRATIWGDPDGKALLEAVSEEGYAAREA